MAAYDLLITPFESVGRMLSRSAIVKLKAILVIDLIIVGAAAGVYFYFQETGIISSASKPATFIFSDLIINPNEVFTGEAVQISINVTNIGDLDGNQTVNLQINNIVKDSINMTLTAHNNETVQFTYIELNDGLYNVTIGDLSGELLIKPAPPESSKIILSNLITDPYEGWIGDNITVTAIAQNPTNQPDKLMVRVMVDEVMIQSQIIELEAGATQSVQFTINASSIGKHTVKLNTLTGSFIIVETGYHTLIINRSGGGSTPLPITLNGETYNTPYTVLLPVGQHRISVPNPFSVGTGVLEFSYWSDGLKSPDRSFTLDKRLYLIATYTLISGYASCPSLYIWNGEGYTYVTEISNAGWLGYIDHINSDGKIVYGGGNPWDYVKLDKTVLATKNGYFDMALFQQWDELFYVDAAHMLVVDHPVGTDVYTTMSNYLNKGLNDYIFTVNKTNLIAPVSAINEHGVSVLSEISQIDKVFTPGSNGLVSPAWNNITLNQLTLNLGDLSSAPEIKLVIDGMVDWGIPGPYYTWIEGFQAAAAQGLVPNGTQIYPAPYMEVMDVNGNWIKIAQDRQMPMPADYNSRSFAVDLTGLFPDGAKDCQIRITNFFNVTFDYIAIDLSTQQDVVVQKITPTADLTQIWETQSPSTGNFTRYGDVTALLLEGDDMYVIGRQGDQINLKFSTSSLAELAEGMERDYFFIVACWFKDPPGGWGYGFNFTVDPLPFMEMTGFPYPSTESYHTDAAHQAYLQQYNTRIIVPP
jgi:hypothetical protein